MKWKVEEDYGLIALPSFPAIGAYAEVQGACGRQRTPSQPGFHWLWEGLQACSMTNTRHRSQPAASERGSGKAYPWPVDLLTGGLRRAVKRVNSRRGVKRKIVCSSERRPQSCVPTTKIIPITPITCFRTCYRRLTRPIQFIASSHIRLHRWISAVSASRQCAELFCWLVLHQRSLLAV